MRNKGVCQARATPHGMGKGVLGDAWWCLKGKSRELLLSRETLSSAKGRSRDQFSLILCTVQQGLSVEVSSWTTYTIFLASSRAILL